MLANGWRVLSVRDSVCVSENPQIVGRIGTDGAVTRCDRYAVGFVGPLGTQTHVRSFPTLARARARRDELVAAKAEVRRRIAAGERPPPKL